MKIPITQSKEWEAFQHDLGQKTFSETGNGYSFLAILKTTPVGNYLYLPYGPVADNATHFKSALSKLEKLAKENHAIFIRIEPQNPNFTKYLPKRTVKSKDLNPAHTLIIDLNREEDEILKSVPRRTRGYFNTYSKKGLSVEASQNPDDIKYLVDLQKTLAKAKNINVFSESYLKKQLSQPFSSLYLVKYTPTPDQENHSTFPTPVVIATVLVFDDADTRYYIQAAQDKDYTKLAAPSIVVCQMLLDARKKGLKYFDFWGIAPEDAPKTHPWYGFTKFKKSFGGEEVRYAGTYDIVINPLKYKLYQSTRFLGRIFHH